MLRVLNQSLAERSCRAGAAVHTIAKCMQLNTSDFDRPSGSLGHFRAPKFNEIYFSFVCSWFWCIISCWITLNSIRKFDLLKWDIFAAFPRFFEKFLFLFQQFISTLIKVISVNFYDLQVFRVSGGSENARKYRFGDWRPPKARLLRVLSGQCALVISPWISTHDNYDNWLQS